jgi:hypothetical protein
MGMPPPLADRLRDLAARVVRRGVDERGVDRRGFAIG